MPPEPAVAARAPISAQSMGCGQARESEETERASCHQWCGRHEGDVDHDQEEEHDAEHDPGEALEHALDRAAEREDQHDDEDEPGGDPGVRLPGRRRPACGPSRRRGASRRRCRPAPASRAGRSRAASRRRPRSAGPGEPHDPAVDRLARIERVADRLEVEDDLEHDRHRRDQEDVERVLDGRRRADQPLAAADGGRGHDRARADHAERVAERERRRSREFGRVPGRQLAVSRRQRVGVRGLGAVHAGWLTGRELSPRRGNAQRSLPDSHGRVQSRRERA